MTRAARFAVAFGVLVAGLAAAAAAEAGGQRHSAAPLTGDPGQQIYQKWCWTCHGPSTPDSRKAGTAALENTYQGKVPAMLEQRTDLTPATIRTFVRTGVYFMPPFRKTEITDAELDSLIAYLTQKKP